MDKSQIKRDENVDYQMLEAYSITLQWHQPWQVSLFHPDIDGKFVWYPERGTLMRETEHGTYKIGEYTDTEEVINEIQKFL